MFESARRIESTGWTFVRKSDRSLHFKGPPDDDGNPIPWDFPAHEEFSDYLSAVQLLVNALTVIEQRSVDEVLKDILAQPVEADVASAS